MNYWERRWGFLVPVKGGASEHSLQGLQPWQRAVTQLTWLQGTERLLGDTGDLAIVEAVPRLDSHARVPHREGGVGRNPSGFSSLQAAELVSKNCEAYEAHMRDVRDYLEARLEVSRPGSCLSLLSWGLSPRSAGPGARVGMSLWPCHVLIRTGLLTIPERFTAL